jgi:transcription termination/antitermination protein NusA
MDGEKMNGELLTALERLEREKGIDKDILFAAIESALVSAARKVIDDPEISKEEISVTINKDTGDIEVFAEGVKVNSERFGRIAAQTAKQVIIQKVREAERDVVSEKYLKKVGTIVSGSVHRFERGNTVVELDDTEAILPRTEQIPRERFRQGESIRAYLLKVDRESGAPAVILSRTDAGFVKKLFELEVPEISQGIVEIKSVAREAGERTKIAVYSRDEKVDPVGACVGMRGSRVRDIVKELHGERIDIVRWDDDIREYLQAAISPAEVTKMVIDRDKNTIKVTVPRDQLALLIGKKGRNIRLASKLLEWDLLAEAAFEDRGVSISEVPGIGGKKEEALQEAGYDTADKVLRAGVEGVAELPGIGPKTAEKILESCKSALSILEDGMKTTTDDDTPASDEDVVSDKNVVAEEEAAVEDDDAVVEGAADEDLNTRESGEEPLEDHKEGETPEEHEKTGDGE